MEYKTRFNIGDSVKFPANSLLAFGIVYSIVITDIGNGTPEVMYHIGNYDDDGNIIEDGVVARVEDLVMEY